MEPKPYEEMIEVRVSVSTILRARLPLASAPTRRPAGPPSALEPGLEEELVRELPPDEGTLLPGPVQQYLQEIGVVRLLTAKQEVELAKKIENGRLLARLQRELTANHQPLSYESLARHLLRSLRWLLDRVRPILDEDGRSYSEILFSSVFQRSIEAEIDLELAEAIADVVGTSGRQVADDLWVLSVGSRLISPVELDAGPEDEVAVRQLATELGGAEHAAGEAKDHMTQANLWLGGGVRQTLPKPRPAAARPDSKR